MSKDKGGSSKNCRTISIPNEMTLKNIPSTSFGASNNELTQPTLNFEPSTSNIIHSRKYIRKISLFENGQSKIFNPKPDPINESAFTKNHTMNEMESPLLISSFEKLQTSRRSSHIKLPKIVGIEHISTSPVNRQLNNSNSFVSVTYSPLISPRESKFKEDKFSKSPKIKIAPIKSKRAIHTKQSDSNLSINGKSYYFLQSSKPKLTETSLNPYQLPNKNGNESLSISIVNKGNYILEGFNSEKRLNELKEKNSKLDKTISLMKQLSCLERLSNLKEKLGEIEENSSLLNDKIQSQFNENSNLKDITEKIQLYKRNYSVRKENKKLETYKGKFNGLMKQRSQINLFISLKNKSEVISTKNKELSILLKTLKSSNLYFASKASSVSLPFSISERYLSQEKISELKSCIRKLKQRQSILKSQLPSYSSSDLTKVNSNYNDLLAEFKEIDSEYDNFQNQYFHQKEANSLAKVICRKFREIKLKMEESIE